MHLYNTIDDLLDKGKSGTLATIIKRLGPTPQDKGAKIFIDESGKVYGTIGGGCVEAEVCKEAREVLNSNKSKIIHYLMNSNDVENEGMICGGSLDILLEPINAEQRDFYKEIGSRISKGIKTTVVTQTAEFTKRILEDNENAHPQDIRSMLKEYDGKSLLFKNGILIESLNTFNRLFIYGAGHISQFIAKIAKLIDFEDTVIDDRASFANRERFPVVNRVIAGYFTEAIKDMNPGKSDFHVIVTRGHRNDAEVLKELLKYPSYYIGMIGSKRKIKIIYNYLEGKGYSNSDYEKVHAPIGISIDAKTPQEIAVSIAAELVKVRAGEDK
jgi:xanthine dehydrogenase accessory factor